MAFVEAIDATAITLDVDWAPDWVIDEVAAHFVRADVRATWFVTHTSPAIDRLRARPRLFELGIHPNFRPGSSHGHDSAAVLRHCLEIVPEARSMRTHSLVQSSPLLQEVAADGRITVDVSLLLARHPGLRPVRQPCGSGSLVRLPFCWEDDIEMSFEQPVWDPLGLHAASHGLKILNFHPIHIVLNSSTMSVYQQLKASTSRLQDLTARDVEHLRQPGAGTGTALEVTIARLAATGESETVSHIADRWQKGGGINAAE